MGGWHPSHRRVKQGVVVFMVGSDRSVPGIAWDSSPRVMVYSPVVDFQVSSGSRKSSMGSVSSRLNWVVGPERWVWARHAGRSLMRFCQ